MNVTQFQEGLELMNCSGFKLTEMEASLIENSLTILMSDNKFQDAFFLGRIDTSGADRYYLAFGCGKDVLKDRKYFYSLNGYEWLLMPTLKSELIPIARSLRTYFHGDPAYVEVVQMVILLSLQRCTTLMNLLSRVPRLSLTTKKFSFNVHQL